MEPDSFLAGTRDARPVPKAGYGRSPSLRVLKKPILWLFFIGKKKTPRKRGLFLPMTGLEPALYC